MDWASKCVAIAIFTCAVLVCAPAGAASGSNGETGGDTGGGSNQISTIHLLASETGFGLGGAVLGGTAGGLSGLIGGGTFVLFNPDVRTQERAGRVLLGSVGVGAGIGIVTGLPFGVFVGGDRLGAEGKQSWATVGSLVGSAAAVTTWGLTWGERRWLPARLAVIPLPLVTTIAAFELSRPADDTLEDEAAPLFSKGKGARNSPAVRVLPFASLVPGSPEDSGDSARMSNWQIGIFGQF